MEKDADPYDEIARNWKPWHTRVLVAAALLLLLMLLLFAYGK